MEGPAVASVSCNKKVVVVVTLCVYCAMPKDGLYANIHAKRKRIAAGSGEKMRKPGSKGAPTAAAFKQSAKTAKGKK
jgi:hypothetical protein